jgi:hypothetical protein
MMKIFFNKSYLLLIFLLSITMASCLKDKGIENGEYGTISQTEGKEYVSIPLAAKASNLMSLEVKTGVQNIKLFQAAYDYVNPAATNIGITMAVNNSLLTAIDPTVVPLPTATYSLPSTVITIPAGKRISDSSFSLNVNTSTLDASKRYGIAFTIASVDKAGVVIPQNMKNVVFIFGVKNKYDGIYNMTGTLVDAASASLTAKSPQVVHLITTGVNSVRVYNAGTTAASFKELFPILSGGSESAYGSFQPEFFFDANNNVIDVKNTSGQPASNTRSASLDPTGVNKWDPATKQLKVKFFMSQPSAIAGVRTSFDMTFTYTGPR